MAVLVLAEHDNGTLARTTLHAVTAAAALESDIHVLVAGHGAAAVAEAAARVAGVTAVLHAEHEAYAHPLAEDLAALLQGVARGYGYVLAGSSTFSRNVLPRLAALVDVQQVSDIVEVLGPDSFKRFIYAGNALATVRCSGPVKVITVRTTAFEAAPEQGGAAQVRAIDPVPPTGLARHLGREVHESARPELTSARVVVSGGRGVGSADNFRLIEELADALGAAVGASRAAVDAGYVPNDYQVGQTGKIVAPELYVAVGISGAIQHLAGMKDSKVIVAINKDEEAPIFQVADYGLVGDLFKVVPELAEEIRKPKG
jgi:electron transfer flavoprotein alpha subunit